MPLHGAAYYMTHSLLIFQLIIWCFLCALNFYSLFRFNYETRLISIPLERNEIIIITRNEVFRMQKPQTKFMAQKMENFSDKLFIPHDQKINSHFHMNVNVYKVASSTKKCHIVIHCGSFDCSLRLFSEQQLNK